MENVTITSITASINTSTISSAPSMVAVIGHMQFICLLTPMFKYLLVSLSKRRKNKLKLLYDDDRPHFKQKLIKKTYGKFRFKNSLIINLYINKLKLE